MSAAATMWRDTQGDAYTTAARRGAPPSRREGERAAAPATAPFFCSASESRATRAARAAAAAGYDSAGDAGDADARRPARRSSDTNAFGWFPAWFWFTFLFALLRPGRSGHIQYNVMHV